MSRIKSILMSIAGLGLMLGLTAEPANAKILFVETFSTGTLPTTGTWNVFQTGTDFVLQDDVSGVGGTVGDKLFTILGYQDGGSPAWGDSIYTKQSFARGNNLRVSFRMWNKFGTNAQTSFHGPWHNSNTGPVYANHEAGVDYTYSDFRWAEATDINPIQSGKSLTGINSNFNGNTKNGAMKILLTLGNVRGARLDWYRTDPNDPNAPKMEPEINTIGQALQPEGQGGINTLVTGEATNVYLGFGNFDAGAAGAGSIYIDDIVVRNDEVANPGGKTILFVRATDEWSATQEGGYARPGGDFQLMYLLEQFGYNVVEKDDQAVQSSDANGVDAVIISSTVGSNNVANKFTDTAKGLMTWEAGLMDDMNLALNGQATQTAGDQTQIAVDGSYTTLTTGLSGNVPVSVNGEPYRYLTTSAAGAIKVASIVGQPTQTAIVAYETGGQMENGFVAPGRRVGFFLGDQLASETLTPQGKQLFRAAVDWIAGGNEITPPPADAGNWNLYY